MMRKAPRPIIRTEHDVTQSVAVLVLMWWEVPKPIGERLLAAIMESGYSRPRELRMYLAAHQDVALDIETVLRECCTPRFMIGLTEDLTHEGRLTHREMTCIQERLLRGMSPTGAWQCLISTDTVKG